MRLLTGNRTNLTSEAAARGVVMIEVRRSDLEEIKGFHIIQKGSSHDMDIS